MKEGPSSSLGGGSLGLSTTSGNNGHSPTCSLSVSHQAFFVGSGLKRHALWVSDTLGHLNGSKVRLRVCGLRLRVCSRS